LRFTIDESRSTVLAKQGGSGMAKVGDVRRCRWDGTRWVPITSSASGNRASGGRSGVAGRVAAARKKASAKKAPAKKKAAAKKAPAKKKAAAKKAPAKKKGVARRSPARRR
jgi:hypothetical protein